MDIKKFQERQKEHKAVLEEQCISALRNLSIILSQWELRFLGTIRKDSLALELVLNYHPLQQTTLIQVILNDIHKSLYEADLDGDLEGHEEETEIINFFFTEAQSLLKYLQGQYDYNEP